MIYPTSSDILRCISHTLLAVADEYTSNSALQSALATSRHLIRHVDLRLRLERSILLDDIEKTSVLARELAVFFEVQEPLQKDLSLRIHASLDKELDIPSSAENEFETIIDRAKTLRELIYVSLSRLQEFSQAHRAAGPYGEVRKGIRDYLRYQIQQEAKLIHPAFSGQGPRR